MQADDEAPLRDDLGKEVLALENEVEEDVPLRPSDTILDKDEVIQEGNSQGGEEAPLVSPVKS